MILWGIKPGSNYKVHNDSPKYATATYNCTCILFATSTPLLFFYIIFWPQMRYFMQFMNGPSEIRKSNWVASAQNFLMSFKTLINCIIIARIK